MNDARQDKPEPTPSQQEFLQRREVTNRNIGLLLGGVALLFLVGVFAITFLALYGPY